MADSIQTQLVPESSSKRIQQQHPVPQPAPRRGRNAHDVPDDDPVQPHQYFTHARHWSVVSVNSCCLPWSWPWWLYQQLPRECHHSPRHRLQWLLGPGEFPCSVDFQNSSKERLRLSQLAFKGRIRTFQKEGHRTDSGYWHDQACIHGHFDEAIDSSESDKLCAECIHVAAGWKKLGRGRRKHAVQELVVHHGPSIPRLRHLAPD